MTGMDTRMIAIKERALFEFRQLFRCLLAVSRFAGWNSLRRS